MARPIQSGGRPIERQPLYPGRIVPVSIEYIADHFYELQPGDTRFSPWLDAVTAYQKERIPIYGRFSGEYLPIEAFKAETLCTVPAEDVEQVFRSSGTAREHARSSHHVASLSLYRQSVINGFSLALGDGPFLLIDYLPDYERQGSESSLLYMARSLRATFGMPSSGSCLDSEEVLSNGIRESLESGVPIVLIGAAFGLLELIERHPVPLPSNAIVIETGGMKTHRREVSRSVLHRTLAAGFHLPEDRIQSEYGMCELLSQCYTRINAGNGIVFYPPPWMRFEVLNVADPGRRAKEGQEGILAVSDMANIHSVSRILTEDLVVQVGGGFEVLGRVTQAELRGCNFLMEA